MCYFCVCHPFFFEVDAPPSISKRITLKLSSVFCGQFPKKIRFTVFTKVFEDVTNLF